MRTDSVARKHQPTATRYVEFLPYVPPATRVGDTGVLVHVWQSADADRARGLTRKWDKNATGRFDPRVETKPAHLDELRNRITRPGP